MRRMPSVNRTVNKSVALCRHLGMTELQALSTVATIAKAAAARIDRETGFDADWITQICGEAVLRIARMVYGTLDMEEAVTQAACRATAEWMDLHNQHQETK